MVLLPFAPPPSSMPQEMLRVFVVVWWVLLLLLFGLGLIFFSCFVFQCWGWNQGLGHAMAVLYPRATRLTPHFEFSILGYLLVLTSISQA